jgi:hypothetical protein
MMAMVLCAVALSYWNCPCLLYSLLIEEGIEYISHVPNSQSVESDIGPDIYCSLTAHHSSALHSAE